MALRLRDRLPFVRPHKTAIASGAGNTPRSKNRLKRILHQAKDFVKIWEPPEPPRDSSRSSSPEPGDIHLDQALGAHKAIIDSFQTEGIKSALQLDIAEFTGKAKRVILLFENISRSLRVGDRLFASSQCGPLSPRWEQHLKTFREIIWESRDLATTIAVSCDQFQFGLLPSVAKARTDAEMEKMMKKLDDQIKSHDEDKMKVTKHSDAFSKLRADVTLFRDNLIKVWEVQDSDTMKEAALKRRSIEKKLGELHAELCSLSDQMRNYANDLDVPVVGSNGVLSLFPRFSVHLINAGLSTLCCGVVNSAKAYSKTESKFMETRVQMENLNLDVHELNNKYPGHIQALLKIETLSSAYSDINGVITGLGSFEEIWSVINSDCQAIKKYLQECNMSNPQPPTPLTLKTWIAMGNTHYRCLAFSLRQYASGLDDAGLKAPGR